MGKNPDEQAQRIKTSLRSPDLIAVNTLGQLSDHPRVAALREFITDWYVSYLSMERTESSPKPDRKSGSARAGTICPM